MEQQFNNDQNEFLRALLANPESNAQGYAPELERLVNQYPHSGILHALLAYAGGKKNLKHASLYFAPASLYKLVNATLSLADMPAGRIIMQNGVNTQQTALQPEIPNENGEETTVHDIDDETYEEIVGIEDIDTEAHPVNTNAGEENELSVESDIETNFFKLDEPFSQDEPGGREAAMNDHAPIQQEVSKYNDDKMPYTFMWWLDKTRREHAGISRPYARAETNGANIGSDTSGLQQQYYENIFHISSLEEIEKKTARQSSGVEGKRKEDMIIERFIQEEPQIKPQSSDKLDTENKAKKSAEDHDELVTETLAAIYTDQMLYHKAIASYKKLMLKFPEKSRYFADKIEQLEKRTN